MQSDEKKENLKAMEMAQNAIGMLTHPPESPFNLVPGFATTLIVIAIVLFVYFRKDLVRLLLRQSGLVDVVDSSGRTALHWACDRGDLDLAQLLLEAGASANLKDRLGQTPLYAVCDEGNCLGLVELLLQFEADVNDRGQRTAFTPLIAAAGSYGKDSQAMVELLVSHGADIHAREDGWTALSMAAFRQCKENVQRLLELGANPNDDGTSPLHCACQTSGLDIARLLIDAGANVNICDQDNETPIFTVIQSYDRDGEAIAIMHLLVERGADVNWRNSMGRTPLHYACLYEARPHMMDKIRLLLDQGADPNASDKNGETPLQFLQVLYRGGYIDEVDSDEEEDGDSDEEEVRQAVRMLLEDGADAEVTNRRGLTPFLYVATRHRGLRQTVDWNNGINDIEDNPDEEMIQVLLDHQMDQLPEYD